MNVADALAEIALATDESIAESLLAARKALADTSYETIVGRREGELTERVRELETELAGSAEAIATLKEQLIALRVNAAKWREVALAIHAAHSRGG